MLLLGARPEQAAREFQQALDIEPAFDDAKLGLVEAWLARAQQLESSDLSEAYRCCERLDVVAPNDPRAVQIRERIVQALQSRMVAGMILDTPRESAWIPGDIRVSGHVRSPSVARLRIVWDVRAEAPSLPFPFADAAIVDADERFVHTLLTPDGVGYVRVQLEDKIGVVAELPPRRVRIDRCAPTVDFLDADTEAHFYGPVALRGTVRDLGEATLSVAGQAVSVANGSWTTRLELSTGRQRVRAVVRDADGFELVTERFVWIDGSTRVLMEANARLRKEHAAEAIDGVDNFLTFGDLFCIPSPDGQAGIPERVKKLAGKRVLLLGYMMPIEEVRNLREFLLCPTFRFEDWSVPNVSSWVRVVVPKDLKLDYALEIQKVVGTFQGEAVMEEGFLIDIFRLEAESIEPVQ